MITDTIIQLGALSPNSEEFNRILDSLILLASPELSNAGETQQLIDIIDRALDSSTTDSKIYQRNLRRLRKICGRTGLLPSSHMLSEGLQKQDDVPVALGGFADVYSGKYRGHQTAIKILRIFQNNDSAEVKKKFCKEVIIWRRLSHPHVVPFLGVALFQSRWCMISGWMTGGNVTAYVNSHPEVDRLKLLKGVAMGLQYLHDFDIVHGDLKGPNILVDGLGHTRLADFGLACILCDPNTINLPTTKTGSAWSIRWTAPEVFEPETAGLNSARPSKASDIYALGMVVLEVFTGNVPFSTVLRDPTVISRVLRGLRPARPENTLDLGLSDEIWNVVQMCWQSDPTSRPVISKLLKCWRRAPTIVDHISQSEIAVGQDPELPLLVQQLNSFYPIMSNDISSAARYLFSTSTPAPLGTPIPQRIYQARGWEPNQPESITFTVENGHASGLSIRNALDGNYIGLSQRDDQMPLIQGSSSISIRILWPGYESWSSSIRTSDWRTPPNPIIRSKLGTEIAKKLQRFIEAKHTDPLEQQYQVWRIGPIGSGFITVDDIVLVAVQRVSRSSWQAVFSLRN